MPKPFMLQRPSGLYVRFFVPKDLQPRVGCKYLVRSLQGIRADAARLMAAAFGYALSKAFERLRMDAMTEPKGLLDVALAGVKKGSYEVYDIELPNGLKIRTDGSDAEHQRVRQTITDLEKVGTHEKNPGDGAGDWFNRTFLRKACKIVDPAKSFHSFRHSFASWAERSGLSDARIARLTGHSSGGSVLRKHYIQVATLQERSEDIGKIRFPAVQAKVLKSNFFEPYFKRLRAVEARKKRTS